MSKEKKSSNRWKNPWMWVGVIGTIISALHVDPSTFTSWSILDHDIFELISNPFAVGSVIMALLGAYVDPTTGGLKD